MPTKPPRVCPCGFVIPRGQCACEERRSRDRKRHHDQTRPSARARGYDAQWDAYRAAYLKANPLCRRCPAPATVVDHIQAHKGNQRLFWNPANHQPLCATCHNRWKQAEEKRQAA